MLPALHVDCSKPPADRWVLAADHVERARELLNAYGTDMGLTPDLAELIVLTARDVVPDAYRVELEALSHQTSIDFGRLLATNLYYDAIKFGCTAVAVETPAGPLHARNPDWWTPNRLLNDSTVVVEFDGSPAGAFTTVGWPGFVGAFSGVAPGRFAVSLNAVLSGEPPRVACPVVFLLRQVLETAGSFTDAVDRLSRETIASDCLLLVTGPRPGEMIVIERTPTRFALRRPIGGAICVTNDYRVIDADTGSPSGELQETSCSRYDRMVRLVSDKTPKTAGECLDYLSDPGVKMDITVQQMVFDPREGVRAVKVP